jgi:hypothetical protein
MESLPARILILLDQEQADRLVDLYGAAHTRMSADGLPFFIGAGIWRANPSVCPANVVNKNDGARGEEVDYFCEIVDIVFAGMTSIMKS